MIFPRTAQSVAAVAAHYDTLDPFYRAIWGEHVHHGLWTTGRETPVQAVEALIDLLAERLRLSPAMRLCDIGCGYGGTARRLAQQHDVDVVGVTVSAAQEASAPPAPRVTIIVQDWLANRFADDAFDRAYAVESSEHMGDKARFFAEAWRTLRPGGLLAVFAWLAADAPRNWQVRHLLEPICREGRLPGMGDEADYRALATGAGFAVVSVEDLTARVSRTWTICARRVLGKLFTDPRYARFLLDRRAPDRVFAMTLLRLIAAYRVGAMRYCLLVFRKDDGKASAVSDAFPEAF